MQIRQIDYKPHHFDLLGDTGELPILNKYDICSMKRRGPIKTIMAGEQPIGIIGLDLSGQENTGTIWLIPSVEHLKKHGVAFARIARAHVKRIEEILKLEKLTTLCYNDDKRARFLEWLGFENKGPHEVFSDYLVFEKVN